MAKKTKKSRGEDPEKKRDEALTAMVDAHVTMLRKHFESVIIAVTHFDEKRKSEGMVRLGGNYYASRGMVDRWLVNQKHRDAD